jgi:basic membrane lipoprotein Med (substrate-binding protein (PBP1-ABC) superfamily)
MSRILPRWLFLSIGLLSLVVFAVACGGSSNKSSSSGASGAAATGGSGSSGKTVTVGFIYVGTVDDGGYNQAAYQGEVAVGKLPGVKTIHAENVPETAEAERVMEQMISQGATIIFATSFGHLDPALNVAKKHPNVTFFHEGGLKSSENLGTFFGTIWQTEYVGASLAFERNSEDYPANEVD